MLKFIGGAILGFMLAQGAFDDYIQVDTDRAVSDVKEILQK